MSGSLTIQRNPKNNMFDVLFRGGKGSVPKALQGAYTSETVAQAAVDMYYAKARTGDKPAKVRKKK